MDRPTAQAEIRKLAPFFDKVRPTKHALIRDPASGKIPLTKLEMMQTLEHGTVVEGPFPDISIAGGWTFAVQRFVDRKTVKVAGVLVPSSHILVITGYEIVSGKRRRAVAKADIEDDESDDGTEDENDASLH
jgi:hypothetical protein